MAENYEAATLTDLQDLPGFRARRSGLATPVGEALGSGGKDLRLCSLLLVTVHTLVWGAAIAQEQHSLHRTWDVSAVSEGRGGRKFEA